MYFALVFLGVFLFMSALLLMKYAQVELQPMPFDATLLEEEAKGETKVKGWIRQVSKLQTSAEVLPVNFMYIEINDNYPKPVSPPPKLNYEIIVPKCTEYSLFCMRRLARTMDIDISVAKIADKHSIFIAAPSAAAANSFVTGLKQYNIHSKIKEVK